jgi:NTE family protein
MRALRLLAAAVLCLGALAAAAQEAAPPARPRVALVLSGGGARGFAHIGVLRVLHELHVPVDIVVGTSMGSVVGGAYAAGASLEDLEAIARYTDWDRVIADRPARDALAFRRREEDLLLPSRIEFGVSSAGLSLPPAAASNAALEAALNKALPAGSRDKPVSQLPLPFRSVASDLVTGELVELADTPLFLTIRASLAVPGVFAPVRVNGRLVADGGLVRNLPVDLAHKMGADIVIAVNVGTPLAPEKELGSAIGVAQQMLNILTEQNVQRSLKELGPRDILVAPDLAGITFLDFQHHEAAIAAGEKAARAVAERLAALAVGPEAYAQEENRRLAPPVLDDTALPLAKLEVHGGGGINAKALAAQTGLVKGVPVTREQVRQAADTLYGRGDLARVETEIDDAGGKRSVSIRATEAPWASNRLRVGLELGSDFRDTNSFSLKLMHIASNLNDWGGELRSIGRVGTARELGVQYFQPLGPGSPWYVAPTLAYNASASDVFNEGRRILRLGFSGYNAGIAFGRELGDWGDVQAGVVRQRAHLSTEIPQTDATPDQLAYDTTQFLRYRADTLDSLAFPTRGGLVDATFERSTQGGNNGGGLAQTSIVGMRAFHAGDWAGHLYGEWAQSQSGVAPLSLGGFLRMSGTPADSVQGRRVLFGRIAMARKIAALPSTLGGALRAGFSFEAGGAYDPTFSTLRDVAFRQAVSGFLAVDTRFGPAYLAAGATRDGNKTFYIFLGPVW